MRRLSQEEKAGIYTTVIVHLAVVIVLLLAGLDWSIRRENTFVLDFSALEEKERLQEELEKGFTVPEEDVADPGPVIPEKKEEKKQEESVYSGPSVVSYFLEGRKASHLPIPAYRCLGAGQVTVLITVNPGGTVIDAKVDDAVSSKDGCLRNFAVRAARLSKFSAKADAPAKQQGNIVYEFVAQY